MLNKERYFKELEEIVNMDSGTQDTEGCMAMAQWFKTKFVNAGFDCKIHNAINPYLECHYQGRNQDKDDIDVMFMGHLDTVFAKGTAAARGYTCDGEKAYGPGVADMKDGALLACNIAEALVESKTKLNLCIAFNTDEETGSACSDEWIKEVGAKAKYCFNFEPGRVGGTFVKERKGVYDYFIDFRGIPSHAGVAPEKGASAIVEMAKWIVALTEVAKPELGTTLNSGIVKGGSGTNVVAASAELAVDLRYTKEEERERVEKAIEDMCGKTFDERVKVSWRRGDGFPPMTEGPGTAKLIAQMEKAAANLGHDKPTFISTGGGSDANNLGGLPVVAMDGCGPVGADYHSDAEYMVLDSVEKRYDILLETIKVLFD